MQRKTGVVMFVLFLAATAAIPGLSQTRMSRAVVSAGGQDMTGASHHIRGTVGQAAIGLATNPAYSMEIGFWLGYRQLVSPVPETPSFAWGLEQNHPNPFNPRTRISYSLPEETHVTLRIFDLRGKRVCTLVDRTVLAGEHAEIWRGRDAVGAPVSSGVYFARLDSEYGVLTRKMVLTR